MLNFFLKEFLLTLFKTDVCVIFARHFQPFGTTLKIVMS